MKKNKWGMETLKLSTLIAEDEINKRVASLGAELTKKFKDKPLVAICVLKGSVMFFADLIRHIDTDVTCEFLGVSSYNNAMKSSGEIKVTLDLSTPVEDKHVLLVEDIVDTGLTMNYLVQMLQARKPKSISTIALLHKPEAVQMPLKLDHVGFEIANEFVVGYGLDYQGYYRNLPFIAQVQNIQ
ncbi:MAG: hypoxanthine phosphoribosyltransferase [Pseudomonadota bacterium]|nr:hypoxanthine phosphoribosyltransferase [Pseudomonadota bacterium]